VRSQLYLAIDLGYIDNTTFEEHIEMADGTARLIGALRSSIGRRLNTLK
jgi:hypothetical protein